jgi:hypothetical protein
MALIRNANPAKRSVSAELHVEVWDILDRKFPPKWVGRGGPLIWPPPVPDLTQFDSFFWGYIKDISVCLPTLTATLTKGADIARPAANTVTPAILINVWTELYRYRICRPTHGALSETAQLDPKSFQFSFLCCIVMPACIALLFYCNHFIDVYCHLFIPTRVALEFMSHRSRE